MFTLGGPLSGVKVLDLSRVLAGPYCTMTLGDLGAEVIKVERPGGSDETRNWGPPYAGGESAFYLCTNRNKKNITLDLKSESGKEILHQLLEDADVLVENFSVGVMERLGLSYEQLEKKYPQLIYCSISGFGQTGPYKNKPGFDYILQAMGGMMTITGSEETGPMKVGVGIVDIVSAMNATIGILAAINERNSSGKGQYIDIALLDSQISILANTASNYLVSGKVPKLYGNLHPNIVPYQPFETKDHPIIVAAGNQKQYKALCHMINREDLINDIRFKTNEDRLKHREELSSILQKVFKEKSSKEWMELLDQNRIANGPINNMKQIFEDPQVLSRNMKISMSHPTAGQINLVGSPLKFSRTPVEMKLPPPLVGEHTDEVLQKLAYDK